MSSAGTIFSVAFNASCSVGDTSKSSLLLTYICAEELSRTCSAERPNNVRTNPCSQCNYYLDASSTLSTFVSRN
jgi:hypothetical protein